ncbi:Mom family adenine methylcarbamoylation protein [Bacteroides sp.]
MDEIVRKSSLMGELVIKQVSKELAREMIIKNHYSHKWNNGGFGKYNFGIFRQGDDRCLGVAVYGHMKNPNAKIFTHPNPKAWMCELNRMWIDDELGKNAETILIAASIKLLRKVDPDCVAIQSFADGRLGCGTIYKASNFRYYGFHYTRFLVNQRTGEVVHEQLFTNSTSLSGYIRNNVGYLLKEFKIYTVRTYRYIYPLDKKFQFCKSEKPYPEYQKGMDEVKWERDIKKIKERVKALIDAIPE